LPVEPPDAPLIGELNCASEASINAATSRNAKAIYQDLVDDHGFTGR
jgi:hypothetical protein